MKNLIKNGETICMFSNTDNKRYEISFDKRVKLTTIYLNKFKVKLNIYLSSYVMLTPHIWLKGFNHTIFIDFLNHDYLKGSTLNIKIKSINNNSLQFSTGYNLKKISPEGYRLISFKVFVIWYFLSEF